MLRTSFFPIGAVFCASNVRASALLKNAEIQMQRLYALAPSLRAHLRQTGSIAWQVDTARRGLASETAHRIVQMRARICTMSAKLWRRWKPSWNASPRAPKTKATIFTKPKTSVSGAAKRCKTPMISAWDKAASLRTAKMATRPPKVLPGGQFFAPIPLPANGNSRRQIRLQLGDKTSDFIEIAPGLSSIFHHKNHKRNLTVSSSAFFDDCFL